MSDTPVIAGMSNLRDISEAEQRYQDFVPEATQSLDRAFSESHTTENAAIELKTLRMASNVPLTQVREIVVPYVCKRVQALPASTNPTGAMKIAEVEKVIKRWGGLIRNLTGDEEEAMADVLLILQNFCLDPQYHGMFPAFLQVFYQDDVISEEALTTWLKRPASKQVGGEKGDGLRDIGVKFAAMLAQADDDDDEDEEDEDESD